MRFLPLFLGVFLVLSASARDELPPVTTVSSVDLQEYIGTWYEIAAIPQFFERKCVGNTTAEYALTPKNQVSVVNSCETKSGKLSIAEGRAKIVDPTTNAKLKVTFVYFLGWRYLFGGDYWILALGDRYSYAVVGSPNRKYAWILSRTPELAPSLLAEATQALTLQSFDTCNLIFTPQKGGHQERTPLCKTPIGL